MSKFPTAEHFCSWAGLAPGDNKSVGKKSTRITKIHDVYNESKFEVAKQKQEALRFKKINADSKKLGFELVPIKQAS